MMRQLYMKGKDMMFYEKLEADSGGRERILTLLPVIRDLEEELQKKTVDLVFSAWKASGVGKLEDLRFSRHTEYPLYLHIRETVGTGMMLLEYAKEHWQDEWTESVDESILLQALILHDIDKPIIVHRPETENGIAHGVLGAMMARDFGFDERVISLIACHSPKSPVRPGNAMMQVLSYADLFSADHILLLDGRKGFFQ